MAPTVQFFANKGEAHNFSKTATLGNRDMATVHMNYRQTEVPGQRFVDNIQKKNKFPSKLKRFVWSCLEQDFFSKMGYMYTSVILKDPVAAQLQILKHTVLGCP